MALESDAKLQEKLNCGLAHFHQCTRKSQNLDFYWVVLSKVEIFEFFQLKLCLIFTKGAHQSAKFQASDCSGEISPNLYFDRLFLLKVHKMSAKKVQMSSVSR